MPLLRNSQGFGSSSVLLTQRLVPARAEKARKRGYRKKCRYEFTNEPLFSWSKVVYAPTLLRRNAFAHLHVKENESGSERGNEIERNRPSCQEDKKKIQLNGCATENCDHCKGERRRRTEGRENKVNLSAMADTQLRRTRKRNKHAARSKYVDIIKNNTDSIESSKNENNKKTFINNCLILTLFIKKCFR